MIFYRTGRIENNIDPCWQSVEVMNVRRPICSTILARDGFKIHREAVQTTTLKAQPDQVSSTRTQQGGRGWRNDVRRRRRCSSCAGKYNCCTWRRGTLSLGFCRHCKLLKISRLCHYTTDRTIVLQRASSGTAKVNVISGYGHPMIRPGGEGIVREFRDIGSSNIWSFAHANERANAL